jgi:hypothetical protein
MKYIFPLFLLFTFTTGATRYVANCGSDSDDGTTADCSNGAGHKPYATIGKILNASGVLTDGDLVYIAPGTYREIIVVAVTSPTVETKIIGDFQNTKGFKDASGVLIPRDAIRLTAYTTSDIVAPSASQNLDLAGRDFLTFEGIVFTAGSATLPMITGNTTTSTNITFRNCTFISTRASATVLAMTNTADVAFHWLIEQNIFLFAPGQAIAVNPATTSTAADYDVDVTVQNNLFLGAYVSGGGQALSVNASGALTNKPGGVKFQNNTVIGTRSILISTANSSTSIKLQHLNNVIYCPGYTWAAANATGQVTDNYTYAIAAASSNVTKGANTPDMATFVLAPRLEIGQSFLYGLTPQPFGGPAGGSPILGWGSAGTPPTLDLLGRTRPSGGASLALAAGAFENDNCFIRQSTVTHSAGDGVKCTGPGVSDYQIEMVSGVATTVSVWMRYDTTYTTATKPQMIFLNADRLGCTTNTKTMTAAVDTWEKLTTDSCTPTASGRATIRLVSRSAAAAGIAYAQDDVASAVITRIPPQGPIE